MKNYLFLIFLLPAIFTGYGCRQQTQGKSTQSNARVIVDVAQTDRERVLKQAEVYIQQEPVTVVAAQCDRSQGGLHDFYSEGDYWWPDPKNPDAAYIRRDGESNPNNFTAHRKAMRRMSIQVASLTAAYKLTGDKKYAAHALAHLRAWFVDEATRMNPNMQYAQAIKGRVPGRGVGLIDGIHFVEPVQAVMVLHQMKAMPEKDYQAIKAWFADFLNWMTTHPYGIDERDRKNNHGTCWVMQAAQYARLTENEQILDYCRERYKNVLLPNQMAENGSFPLELKRTKPYGYSLFNLDAMAMVCQILSTPKDNLWTFSLPDGRGMRKAMEFMFPYIRDKSLWPFQHDVMYWDQWPVRQPSLLFGGMALNRTEYIKLWKKLKPLPETDEGLRNFPIREPLLWVDAKQKYNF